MKAKRIFDRVGCNYDAYFNLISIVFEVEPTYFILYIAILQGYRFEQESKAEEKNEVNEEENDETADRSLTKV